MPPIVVLIRHAQAEHNVINDWSVRDAPLTDLGKEQCLELQEGLQNSDIGNQVECIIVSAQRRTLQTATIALDWLIQKGIPVIPDANWQELTDKPCDTGSSIDVISKEFPQYDFSSVDPIFPDKKTNPRNNRYAFTQKAVLSRGQDCLDALYSRSEKVVAVVSHAGFLRTAVCNRRFHNADWRVFEFAEEDIAKTGYLSLREKIETEEKGGGMGRSDVGVFGVMKSDFPPEQLDEVNHVWELD